MSFKFVNSANVPVNIAVSNGGVIYFHKNALNPGESWSCDPAWVWYDVKVFWSTPHNHIDPVAHNWAHIGSLAATTVGAAISVGAIALTGGAATPVVAAVGAAGAVTGVTGVVFEVVNAALNPADVNALYGVDNYTVTIKGGFKGLVNGKTLHVSEIKPLELHWKNNTSGTHGVEKARA